MVTRQLTCIASYRGLSGSQQNDRERLAFLAFVNQEDDILYKIAIVYVEQFMHGASCEIRTA